MPDLNDNILVDKGLELWKIWKKAPTDINLRNLLEFYNTIIMKRVSMFSGANIPKPTMIIAAKKLAVDAFNTYSPNRDTNLQTHIYTNLKRLSRFVGDRQNMGHLPENRRLKIQQYTNMKNTLSENLGREASSLETAEMLNWPVSEIERMEKELRPSIIASTFESDVGIATPGHTREHRIIRNIYYELNPQEQVVYEYLMGMNGKPKLSETKIADKLNTSVTKVSRIKKGIVKKIEKWK
jgi:DNA-directed RNA polymerase specialized sigma subunit